MINPYKKIKELERKANGLAEELNKRNNEIRELKGIPNTSIHPKYKTLIKEVKEIKGRMLYQFKNMIDMPHKRYISATNRTTEFNMRMDSGIMSEYQKIGSDLFNQILESENLTKTRKLAHKGLINTALLERNINMLISVDASYRLASCVFFWIDEDLDDYDFEIGDEKIKLFKEIGFDSFFLTKPMNNFLPPIDISAEDLKAYSVYEKELKKLLSRQSNEVKEQSEKAT